MNIQLRLYSHLRSLTQFINVHSSEEQYYNTLLIELKQLISQIDNNKTGNNDEILVKEINLLKKVLLMQSSTIRKQTLQLIQSIITDSTITIKEKTVFIPYIVEIILLPSILNDHSMNLLILSIVDTIINLETYRYLLRGRMFIEVFDICFDIYLHSVNDDNEDIQKYVCITIETLIKQSLMTLKEVSININNNQDTKVCLLSKEKWLNIIQKDALNIYKENYLDQIEFNINSGTLIKSINTQIYHRPKVSLQKPLINEKGIESGLYGFCIKCRNQAYFYSNDWSFPFCSIHCFNEIIVLIKKIDSHITIDNNTNDSINLIRILSLIISLNSPSIHEFKAATIIQMKYYSMTLIYNIFSHLLHDEYYYLNKDKLIKTIKKYLYPYVILSSALSSDYKTFVLANELQLQLLNSDYSKYFKTEIGLFVEDIYSMYLHSEVVPLSYKTIVIDSLSKLIDNSFAIELFVNYDCDLFSMNLYCELLEVITKIIYGIYDKRINELNSNNISYYIGNKDFSELQLFRIQCLDLISKLINHLDFIVKTDSEESTIFINKSINPNLNNKVSAIKIPLDNSNPINLHCSKQEVPMISKLPSKEVTKRILLIKEDFKTAIEKFNINPINCLKYLVFRGIILTEEIFNYFKDKYNNQPILFQDNSEDEEEALTQHSDNHISQYNFLNSLLNRKDKGEQRIVFFLSQYSTDNEIITYDHYFAFEMANFIHCNFSSINKSQLASFLCSSKQFNLNALFYYINVISFTNHHITEALRLLFNKLPIIKEPQIIQHTLQLFAIKYDKDNRHIKVKFSQQTYVIALSAFELSQSITLEVNKTNQTLSDFVEKTKSIAKCEVIDLTLLCDVYNRVIANPILITYLDNKLNHLYTPQLKEDIIRKQDIELKFTNTVKLNSNSNDYSNYYNRLISTDDIINLIQCSWSNYLGIFSQMVNEYSSEQLIQKCINNLLTVARISGMLHLYIISDTFITTIINLTSITEIKELQPKNIQSLRSLLSFILANGKYISSSWYLILSLMSKLDYYYSEVLSLSIERRISESLTKHIPYHLIESVYSCTIMFPSKQLNDFMLALCDVVKDETNMKTNRSFSLHKVIEVANFNLFREQSELESLWRIIYETFISVIIGNNKENISICTNIIDSLRQINLKFLNKVKIGNTFQVELFKPFEKLFNKALMNNCSIIIDMILECLVSITNSLTRNIGSGWIVIFDIIKREAIRKEESNNSAIFSVLNSFNENIVNNIEIKEIVMSYIQCLCVVSLNKDKTIYSKMIYTTCKLSFNQQKPLLQSIKWCLYGFDEIIKTNPLSYVQLLFELLTNNIDSLLQTNTIWDYCYYFYLRVHLVIIVLFCFVYRTNLWKSKEKDNHFYNGFKEEAANVHLNIMLYLKNTMKGNMIESQDYINDSELIQNTIDYFKKYDLNQYNTLVESFVGQLLELIHFASTKKELKMQYYIEDIIITLLELSLFNQTPETLFVSITHGLSTYKTQITTEGWTKIELSIFNIFTSISNVSESLPESQIEDILSYLNQFSTFYDYLFLYFFKEIKLSDKRYKLHFACCHQLITSLIIIGKKLDLFINISSSNSQLICNTINNMTLSKALILDQTHCILMYFDETILNSVMTLNKLFIDYKLETEDNHLMLNIILVEIQTILPKFIRLMNKEELQRVYSFALDILLSNNKTLRQSAKKLIELLVEKKLVLFTSKNSINTNSKVN